MVSSTPHSPKNFHESVSPPRQSVCSTHELIIEGAGCASCVVKIEDALNKVPGVEAAVMNFAQRTVTVTGDVLESELIKAVEGAGYNAKGTQGEVESDLLQEKEKADPKEARTMEKQPSFWWTPKGLAALGLIGAASYFLFMEHQEHVFQLLPFLILLLCPLMHIFMHGGHGGHGQKHSKHEQDE